MTTTHRSRKNTGLLSLVFPLLYLSIGALIGFVLCFSWLQSGGSPPIGSSPTTRSSLIQPVLSTRERAYQDEQDFFAIASKTKTDKVGGLHNLADCLEDDSKCTRPSCVNPRCRPWGHFYHTIYQSCLGHLSSNSTLPFQMLEIGFYHGKGYEAYREFFPQAEIHSMEISCLPKGPRDQGKWPHGNFAIRNKKWYSRLRNENRLHCGDASEVHWLDSIWNTHMKRPDAPPLKLVIDDGSHLARHMVQTVFYWFPRIAPGGYLVVEDVQPTKESNKFRTQFLPQIISDVHYCGDPSQPKDEPCNPLLQRLLQSVHCEMHICVLERNQEPAILNLTVPQSTAPRSALSLTSCKALRDSFGLGM